MKSFLTWVLYSSTNADKISLTVKGAMVAIVPILMHFFPMADLSQLTEGIVMLVQQVLGLIATIMLVYGGIRKLVTTVRGTNAVLGSHM